MFSLLRREFGEDKDMLKKLTTVLVLVLWGQTEIRCYL